MKPKKAMVERIATITPIATRNTPFTISLMMPQRMRTAFGVFGILWDIIREIINGVFRVAIGVIVAILSTIAYFGFILWLFTL